MRRPFEVYNNQRPGGAGIDSITLGLLSQRAPNIDRFFTPELTVRLFSENPPGAPGTDLASLNLQRGRDHGIPGRVAWIFNISEQFCKTKMYFVETKFTFTSLQRNHLIGGSIIGRSCNS